MKMFYLLLSALLSLSGSVIAQAGNDIASLLFKDVKTKLTVAEKKQLATDIGFVASGNKEHPFAQDKDSKEYPFTAMVLPTDLNKDGIEEIFVSFGNSYTSGNTGSSIVLFIKNATGKYETNLGFPGTVPDAFTTLSKGYPDLLIGGPGFEFPVWRWNGKAYDFLKKVNEKIYNTTKLTNIEEVSKAYQKSIQ